MLLIAPLFPSVIQARAGERVVDYCAGRGGKTWVLAQLVAPDGLVRAWDVEDFLRQQLVGARQSRAQAQGLVEVLHAKPQELGEGGDGRRAGTPKTWTGIPFGRLTTDSLRVALPKMCEGAFCGAGSVCSLCWSIDLFRTFLARPKHVSAMVVVAGSLAPLKAD